jgi:hypothetical protein
MKHYNSFGPNPYGIFAVHDITLCKTDFEALLNGPVAAAEPKLLEETGKPLDLKTVCPEKWKGEE